MTPFAQAAVLVCAQAPTLRDPLLLADPLFAVSGAASHAAELLYNFLRLLLVCPFIESTARH